MSHSNLMNAFNFSIFLLHPSHLHVGHLSLTLTAHDLLDLRVLGQRVTRTKLGLAKAHRNVRVNECHVYSQSEKLVTPPP